MSHSYSHIIIDCHVFIDPPVYISLYYYRLLLGRWHTLQKCPRNRHHRPNFDAVFGWQFFVPMHDFWRCWLPSGTTNRRRNNYGVDSKLWRRFLRPVSGVCVRAFACGCSEWLSTNRRRERTCKRMMMMKRRDVIFLFRSFRSARH